MDKVKVIFSRELNSDLVKASIFVNGEARRKNTCPNDDDLYYNSRSSTERDEMNGIIIITDTIEAIFNTNLNKLKRLREHPDGSWWMLEFANYDTSFRKSNNTKGVLYV